MSSNLAGSAIFSHVSRRLGRAHFVLAALVLAAEALRKQADACRGVAKRSMADLAHDPHSKKSYHLEARAFGSLTELICVPVEGWCLRLPFARTRSTKAGRAGPFPSAERPERHRLRFRCNASCHRCRRSRPGRRTFPTHTLSRRSGLATLGLGGERYLGVTADQPDVLSVATHRWRAAEAIQIVKG